MVLSPQARYETAFELVAGNLKNTIHTDKISEFIKILFPSYPHRISTHNIREFFEVFGRNGSRSKELSWADVRKALREQKASNLTYDSLFLDSALNPNGWIYRTWSRLMDALALYYFILVPVRIAFVPWNSMLDVSALATELFADLLNVVNLLVLCNTAYLSSRSSWITKRQKILRRIRIGYIFAAIPLDWYEII
jgi:hypothetical protein